MKPKNQSEDFDIQIQCLQYNYKTEKKRFIQKIEKKS
jgi:hypothetical protein